MRGADLLKEARRRSGLTQQQLAARMRRKQSTIARWETGRQEPSFSAVVEAVRACGLELDMSIASGDDSYLTLIRQQKHRSHTERLAHSSTRGVRRAVEALAREDVRYLLVGDLAAALRGSPVSARDRLQIVPEDRPRNRQRLDRALTSAGWIVHPPDRSEFWLDAVWKLGTDAGRAELMLDPPGTRGYSDLRRDSELMELKADQRHVRVDVASVVDLLRIADATGDPDLRASRPALQALLDPPTLSVNLS
jgi:transcriptional regulator with XRE-family HTH domain